MDAEGNISFWQMNILCCLYISLSLTNVNLMVALKKGQRNTKVMSIFPQGIM